MCEKGVVCPVKKNFCKRVLHKILLCRTEGVKRPSKSKICEATPEKRAREAPEKRARATPEKRAREAPEKRAREAPEKRGEALWGGKGRYHP